MNPRIDFGTLDENSNVPQDNDDHVNAPISTGNVDTSLSASPKKRMIEKTSKMDPKKRTLRRL